MSDVIAFAGAEGFGASTVGGRGGQVVTVTNLDDSGVGSLRWALQDVAGPRTVVFAVNGVIQLKDQIVIREPNVTIAGQTAPGDGITLEGARLHIRTSEVIVRGMKFRPGDGVEGEDVGNRDGLFIGTTDYEIKNVIVDHNSISWGLDENLTISGHVTNTTLSNNIVAEGLSHSVHPDGEHSKGILISNWGSLDPAFDSRLTIVKNLLAHNFARNPEIKAGQSIEVINNYMYDYGLSHLAFSIGAGNNGTLATTIAAIGNVFDPGPSTENYKMPIAFQKMGEGSSIFLSDNFWTKIAADAYGNQDQGKLVWNNGGLKYLSSDLPFALSATEILDSAYLLDYILTSVGASPYDRDATDTRIIQNVIDQTGKIIDTVAEAGDSAYHRPVQAASDTDHDGMPDWFENLYGFDAGAVDSAGDADADGYTNLEEFINGIYTGFDLPFAREITLLAGNDGIADVIPADAAGGSALTVFNFDYAGGDRIDLSGLLSGYDPLTAPWSDFIEIDVVAGNTVISVDRDGRDGPAGWEVAAVLVGVHDDVGARLLANSPIRDVRTGETVVTGATYDDIAVRTGTAAGVAVGAAGPVLSLSTGDGDDRITLVEGPVAGTVDGGPGADVLSIGDPTAADLTQLTLIGIERIETLDNTITANADQFASVTSIVRSADALANSVSLKLASAGSIDFTQALEGRPAKITGSDGADTIIASNGADVLHGASGDDSLDGGTGNDSVFGDDGADTILGGDGDDKLDGGAGADSLFGGEGSDELLGGAGDDILDGGAGNDVLRGGAGADIYYVDSDDDGINERFGQTVDDGAIDLIISSADRAMTRFTDNLIFVGAGDLTGIGNDLANVITGNVGRNLISGMDGADTLFGMEGDDSLNGGTGADTLDGGTGHDRLAGGTGDDVYILNDNDLVTELVGEGTDTVIANFDYTLGAELETLVLAGTANLSGTGNEAANTLRGNEGDNRLEGRGGADTLEGGAGFDLAVYAHSQAGVTVDLAAGTGLGGDAEGDRLSGIESVVGSQYDDRLTGDDGANRLDGGAGNDTLIGGRGDDVYVIADADTVTEETDGGTDTVEASIDYALGAEIERLVLTGASDLSGTGNALANEITGNAGANRLVGGAGADTLDGGEGLDTADYRTSAAGVTVDLLAGTGLGGDAAGDRLVHIENLVGSIYADRLTGDDGDNVLDGGAGADRLDGGAGVDTADYTRSAAAIVVDLSQLVDGASRPLGGDARGDSLVSIENIRGTAFADRLTGDAGANALFGGAGNDMLDGGAGADRLEGGSGNDTYVVDDLGDVVVETEAVGGVDVVRSSVDFTLGAHLDHLTLTGLAAISGFGNTLANVINGNEAANFLFGDAGRDTIWGGGGGDVLFGGDDSDRLDGGAGADILSGDAGDDQLTGGAGMDVLQGSTGNDRLFGGEGDDTLDGGVGNDNIAGDEGSDHLFGGEGLDTLDGGAGDDSLFGGAGVDRLDGGAGADEMSGGAGNDLYWIDDAGDRIIEFAGGGSDSVTSAVSHVLEAEVEHLILVGTATFGIGNDLANKITGNDLANDLEGGVGNDMLAGAGGDDELHGGSGTDKLYGGDGNDTLYGEVGQDRLEGGAGADTMFGGSSHDVFVFLSSEDSNLVTRDLIADFDVTDEIDVSAFDADVMTAGRQHFAFIGTAEFTGAAQLRYSVTAQGSILVEGDTDGDLRADFSVALSTSMTSLTAADFML
ncbi:type I secretion C-terminal target domain-containing protein [Aureimonas sp. AU12]|uniref:type I secretion C-terminal target domain-containing protein n=1 Tax=Aureimonas sp. AU12 TaxID=1638161 RepID=UPI000781B1FA|nr:type I secretion C-terminal target domain-containing protein [Aureimonas sp. AU12]